MFHWPDGLAVLGPEDIADSLTGLIVMRGTGQSYGCRILLIGEGNQNGATGESVQVIRL